MGKKLQVKINLIKKIEKKVRKWYDTLYIASVYKLGVSDCMSPVR